MDRPVAPHMKEMAGILRKRVSKENQAEFANEKRAKELSVRGYNQGAIAGMMQISEREARKLVDHRTKRPRSRANKPTMVLDGDVA